MSRQPSLAQTNKATRKTTLTNEGSAEFLNATLGPDGWSCDASQDAWIAPDKRHTGPGRGFYVVQRGGKWHTTVVPEAVLS